MGSSSSKALKEITDIVEEDAREMYNVSSIQVDPDTRLLWVAQNYTSFVILNKQLKHDKAFETKNQVVANENAIEFRKDKKLVMMADAKTNTMYIVNKKSGKVSVEKNMPDAIVAMAARENRVAILLENGNILIFDETLQKNIATLQGTQLASKRNGLCFTKCNNLVVGDYYGNKIRVYEELFEKNESMYTEIYVSPEELVDKPLSLTYCDLTDQILITCEKSRNIVAMNGFVEDDEEKWEFSYLIDVDYFPRMIAFDSDPSRATNYMYVYMNSKERGEYIRKYSWKVKVNVPENDERKRESRLFKRESRLSKRLSKRESQLQKN